RLNFMVSVVKDIGPRDQIEAMLAAQMAAVQLATMTFARHLANGENIPQQDSAERAFNKLARTFTTQMEALKNYRSKGALIEQADISAILTNSGISPKTIASYFENCLKTS